MTDHLVVTAEVLGAWRSWCGCGWRIERKTLTGALNAANRHMDGRRAAVERPAEESEHE